MNNYPPLSPIATEEDYNKAIALVEPFFDQEKELDPASPEFHYFDALCTLIEAYENKHCNF